MTSKQYPTPMDDLNEAVRRRDRLLLAMYIASSAVERPATHLAMRRLGFQWGRLSDSLRDLERMGVIIQDPLVNGKRTGRNLRVLPGWKEKVRI